MALHFPALSAAIATMNLSRPDAGLYDRTAAGEGRSSAPASENLVALAKSLAALTTGDKWNSKRACEVDLPAGANAFRRTVLSQRR
jgi:hypothetical protein